MLYVLSDELAEIAPCAEEIQCRDQLGNTVGLDLFIIDHNHDVVQVIIDRSCQLLQGSESFSVLVFLVERKNFSFHFIKCCLQILFIFYFKEDGSTAPPSLSLVMFASLVTA